MREISGGTEPAALVTWRTATPGVGYGNLSSNLRDIVKGDLILEQRALCAYTGMQIALASSHIEHLVPQVHCTSGRDVSYSNMVACYPAPGVAVPFGAVRKGDWPNPANQRMFVSPRSSGCEGRFAFNLSGQISATNTTDPAAQETIKHLGLNHLVLISYRKVAIDATLSARGRMLDLRAARKRLAGLNRAEASGGTLEPFCVVLKQALTRHINRLVSNARPNSDPK